MRRVIITLFGTKDNCDTAVYIYNFLLTTFEDLWKKKRLELGIKMRRNYSKSFYSGLYSGFCQKLEEERQKNTAEDSKALILISEDLNRAVEEMQLKIRTKKVKQDVKGNSYLNSMLYRDGIIEGKKISIARSLSDGNN